jgi:hypothetical protein
MENKVIQLKDPLIGQQNMFKRQSSRNESIVYVSCVVA